MHVGGTCGPAVPDLSFDPDRGRPVEGGLERFGGAYLVLESCGQVLAEKSSERREVDRQEGDTGRGEKLVELGQELVRTEAGQRCDVVTCHHGIHGNAELSVQDERVSSDERQDAKGPVSQGHGVGNQPRVVGFHDRADR